MNRVCESLVRVGHRMWSRKIARPELSYLKSCCRDELVDLTIEVAIASDGFPDGREPVLPEGYIGVGSAAVLEKDEAPAFP